MLYISIKINLKRCAINYCRSTVYAPKEWSGKELGEWEVGQNFSVKHVSCLHPAYYHFYIALTNDSTSLVPSSDRGHRWKKALDGWIKDTLKGWVKQELAALLKLVFPIVS